MTPSIGLYRTILAKGFQEKEQGRELSGFLGFTGVERLIDTCTSSCTVMTLAPRFHALAPDSMLGSVDMINCNAFRGVWGSLALTRTTLRN